MLDRNSPHDRLPLDSHGGPMVGRSRRGADDGESGARMGEPSAPQSENLPPVASSADDKSSPSLPPLGNPFRSSIPTTGLKSPMNVVSEVPKVFQHQGSSARGYVANLLGEWRMLNALHYADSDDTSSQEECVCWQRVQAMATVATIRSAQGNQFLKCMLGVKVTEFGIPLTFGGTALLWRQMQSVPWILKSFPKDFGLVMHQLSWWIGTLVMALLLLATLVKLAACRASVLIEAVDHKRNSFLFTPLLAAITLDLSYPYTSMYSQLALQLSFYIPFVLQLSGSLVMYRSWMFDQDRGMGGLGVSQPSFLMGTVGWMFCAVLAIRAGNFGFGWFSFSIGILMYMMVTIFSVHSLPAIIKTEGVRWTVFLNIAPPSVLSSAVASIFSPVMRMSAHRDSLVSKILLQLFFVYIGLFLAALCFLEFSFRFFPRRYIMELWAMAFPTVALASALLQGTMLPLSADEGRLLQTLLVPRWLAIAAVCVSLCITIWLSLWLLVSLWRRQPKFIFQDGLLFATEQALQKRTRKQCNYCAIRLELGLIREEEEG